ARSAVAGTRFRGEQAFVRPRAFVARRRVSLYSPGGVRRVSVRDRCGGLLRTLCRRGLGTRAPDRIALRRIALHRRGGILGSLPVEAQSICQQAFFLILLSL